MTVQEINAIRDRSQNVKNAKKYGKPLSTPKTRTPSGFRARNSASSARPRRLALRSTR
jgi:hypothetical protein